MKVIVLTEEDLGCELPTRVVSSRSKAATLKKTADLEAQGWSWDNGISEDRDRNGNTLYETTLIKD